MRSQRARSASAFSTSFKVDATAFHSAFRELPDQEDALLLVADGAGSLLGYVLAFEHNTFFANGKVAWVEELMVVEQRRREGIGRKLMQAAEAWARSRGSTLVALATRRAASFYVALGYEESATYFRKVLGRR